MTEPSISDDLDKPYFTMNNLHVRFRELDSNAIMFSGYMHAIDRIIPGFMELAEAAENFDDFKKKVIDYANEHIEFRDRIDYLRNDDDALCDDVDALPPALRP